MEEFHTRNFHFSDELLSLGIDGFGGYARGGKIKRSLHQLFQRVLFWNQREVFESKSYKLIREICEDQGRILDLDALRHVFTFEFLARCLDLKHSTVCVIGDGVSNFVAPASMLSERFRHVISVNLPEILVVDYMAMRNGGFGSDRFILVAASSELKQALQEKDGRIILVSARNNTILENQGIDLFVNIASFQEMNEQLVAGYFEIIRSNRAHLYCCNREDKTLYGGERLVFDSYPWGDAERLVWGDCSWHQRTYSSRPPFFGRYDGNIMHALVKFP